MLTDTTVQPPATVPAPAAPLNDFFSAAEARTDRWRQLSAVVRAWQAAATRGRLEDSLVAEALGLFGDVAALEFFFAYPGPRLMAAIEQALVERNTGVSLRLVQQVSTALMTSAYRHDGGAWDPLQ
ncbi:MAG TPA: hypothetical protein VIX63_12495, partial [Vicinamibacterales bacterium]